MKSGLVTKNWTFGSHDRRSFVGHLIGTKLLYRGLLINRGKFRCVFEDLGVESLLKRGKISPEMKEKYYEAAISLLTTTDILQSLSNEKLVWELHKLKLERLGISAVREGESVAEHDEQDLIAKGITGIDDSEMLSSLKERRNVLFYVSEFPYIDAFTKEFREALSAGHEVAVVAAENSDGYIPTVEELKKALFEKTAECDFGTSLKEPSLAEAVSLCAEPNRISNDKRITWISVEKTYGCMDFSKVDTGRISSFSSANWFLRGFGEDALMCARNLTVDAVIDVLPSGIPTRAVCNQFFEAGLSRVYVPKEFDIIPYVPLVTPSKMTFYHLSYLRKKYGEQVYTMRPEALYSLESGLFFDFYGGRIPYETEEGFLSDQGDCLSEARCRYVEQKFSTESGVKYQHAYLEKDTLMPSREDYEVTKKQHKILVDVAIAGKEATVTPVNFTENVSPREYLKDHPYQRNGLMSNFAFFFTNRLRMGYNQKRKDRPMEQLATTTGYIDYFRYTDERGERHESFPLYRKSAIGKTADGRHVAFQQYLSSGMISFCGGVQISFSEEDLNPSWDALCEEKEVAIYTPMCSELSEQEELSPEDLVLKAEAYAKVVGAGRLNLVIIGEKVTAVREGDVLMTPIGVVLSLSGAKAEEVRRMLGKQPDFDNGDMQANAGDELNGEELFTDGYYDLSSVSEKLSFRLSLRAPKGISQETFDQLEWVYGGLLGLIRNGEKMTEENYQDVLSAEGWMTPLSIETQESRIHQIALHPRTAVGVTKQGEFFVIVLSGRSNVSEGADYFDICRIAEKLVPEIDFLINGDGGGSSFMGYVKGDRLTELNYTAPSEKSIAGLVRPVSSILVIQ